MQSNKNIIKYNPNIEYKRSCLFFTYMKFSSFSLFLLLLFVLVLVIVVSNWFQPKYDSSISQSFLSNFSSSSFDYFNWKTTEGLIAYYGDVSYGSISVSNYTMTRNVHKLYDCVYYDPSNGTVILLDGNTYTEGDGNYDYSGNTLTRMTLVERDGTKIDPINIVYNVSGDYQSAISKKPMRNLYKSFTVTSNVTTQSVTPDKYELIYVSWGKETFLHLITLEDKDGDESKNKTLQYTYVYDSVGNVVETVNNGSTQSKFAVHNIKLSATVPGSHDQYDGTLQPVLGYDTGNTKFQLCKNNFYDMLNGDIIQYDSSNRFESTIKIYSRVVNKNNDASLNTYTYDSTDNKYNPTLPTPTDNVPNVASGFRAVAINGNISTSSTPTDSYYSILYVSIGQRTVITVLNPTNSGEYEIRKVYRIQNKKINDGAVAGQTSVTTSSGGGSTEQTTSSTEMDDLLYQYILKTMLNGYNGSTINDYMLKTQIVPPVCPTCPSCPSSGVCNNCGGNGGSGTKNTNAENSDTIAGVANNAVSGTVGVAKDVVGGTIGLARDTVGGTVGLARDTVGGTVDLARDAVGGTVGLVKDTVGGTVGLAKETVGGVANTFGRLAPTDITSDNTNTNSITGSYYAGGGRRGTSITTGSDHSSYFGALPPKGGDYIPVTADFSRFGR